MTRSYRKPGVARDRFSIDDLQWAVCGWAKVAPGLGGWGVRVVGDADGGGQVLQVAPPSPLPDPFAGPKFVIAPAPDGAAVLLADCPGSPLAEIGRFMCLSDALDRLCPLTAAQEHAADMLVVAAASLQ